MSPKVLKRLKAVTNGQCDARLMVTFPAAGHHRPLQYLIILLGDRGTCVWTTCPRLLPERLSCKSNDLTITLTGIPHGAGGFFSEENLMWHPLHQHRHLSWLQQQKLRHSVGWVNTDIKMQNITTTALCNSKILTVIKTAVQCPQSRLPDTKETPGLSNTA